MAEKDFEADDLELKDYAFEPETYTVNDVQITDYTGIEHDKIFLVNKKDILTKPRPSWIPELDENCLEREDFLPHCVKDSDGYYFVQKTSLDVPEDYNGPKLSDYEKRQKFTKKTYYKMSLDLIAATCDYYIKKRRAEIKLSGDTHRVGFPRSAGSMTWARYDDMVSMFSLCEAYKDDPEITKNYGHVKARRSNPKHKGYIRQTEIAFHDHYGPLLQELKDKKLDMNLQKQDAADTHKKGEETSYGMSGRSETLKKDYGVTIKKQNGTNFDSQQLKNISEALENVWNHYGKLDDVAIAFNLGISYAANTLQHARKAVGIFHPEYHAIGVSFFEEKVADSKDSSMVLCHEVAHWLDFEKGNRDHFHYASDKNCTLENKIALKFKELVRKRNSGGKKLGDYWYRTCECLARAMEEDYGLKHDCYDFYNDQAYLTPEVFKKEISPLVEQLLEENRTYFNLVKKENLSMELSTAKDLSFFDVNENALRKLIKSYTSSAALLEETEKSKPDTFNYLRGASKAMDNKIYRYQEKITKLQTKVDVLNMLVHLETKQPFGQFEMKTLEADICPVDRDDILRMDKNTFEYYAAVINSALKNAGFSEKKSIPLVLKNPSGYTFNTLNILEDGNIEVVSGSVNSLSEDDFKAIEEKNLGLLKTIFDEVKIQLEKNRENNIETSEKKIRWFSVHYKQIAEDRAEFLDHIHKNQEIESLNIHKTLLENHLEIQGCILGGTGMIDSAYESFVCSGADGFKYLLTPHNSEYYKTDNKIIVSDKVFDSFEDAVKACIEEEIKVYKPEITDYKIAGDSGYFFLIPKKYREFILDYILENKKEIVTEAEEYAAKNNISEKSQKEKLRHYIGISMEGYNKYRFDNPEWSKIIDEHVKQIENSEKTTGKTKYKANDQKYILQFLNNKLKEAGSPQKNKDFSIDYSEEKPGPVQQDLFEISENKKEYWITDKDGNRITNSDAKKIIKDNLDLLNRLSEEKTPAANSKMVTVSYISDYLLERLNKEDAQEVKNFTESFYSNIRNDYLSSLSDERIAILLGKGSGSGFSFNESEANFFRKNLEKKLVGNDYFIGTLQTVVNDFSKEWSNTLEKENPQLISLLKKACDESIDYESRLYTAYLSYHYKHDPDDVAGYSLETFKDIIVNDRTLMEKYLSAYPEFEKLHNEYIEHNKISDKANLVSIFKEHNRNIKITEKRLSGRIYNAADTNPEALAIYYDDVKNEQSGLLLSESMAAIIASHQGEPFATWLENISSDVRKVYPEITDKYIRNAIGPLKLGFGHGRKMHTLILQDHNYESNISKETNMTETTKPHSFFIKDTAEFDAFADFEPVTNLTAVQAVKKYAELRKDGYSCGIGMHIPGDFIFDDPDGNGITLVVNHEGTAVFDIYGDTFIDQLQEKDIENGRARLYIDLYKELYNAFESEGVSVKKPQFVFDKESELFIENKNLSHKGISFYEWAKKDPDDARSLEYIICNKDSKAYFDDSQTISNNLMNFLRNSEFVNADYSDDKITVTLNFDDESFGMCQNELVKLDIDWGLEHRIHQVITYSRDTLDDDKLAFASFDEAQSAAKDYLSNDSYKDENGKPYYDGVCVLNNKTKEIEFTQGLFPSKEIFSLDILDKNNFELTPNEISNRIENIYGYFFEYESNENTVDIYQYEKNENGSINKDGPQNFIGSLDSEGNFGFTDDYTEKLPDAVGQAAAMYFREITKSVSAEIELDPENEEFSVSDTDEINEGLIKAEREVFQKKILQLKEELKNIENDRYQDASDKEIQDQVNQINEYIEKYENITDADIKNIILWRRKNFEEIQNNAREVEADRNTKHINDSSVKEGELFSYNDLHPYFTLKNRNTGRETVIQPKGRDVENIKDFARLSSLTEAEKLIEAIKSKGFGIYTTYQRAVIFNDELYYDFDDFAKANNMDKNIHHLGRDDFIKYIKDFKISRNMKLFLENKKPEKKEYTLSDFDSVLFWEKYRSNYDKYYNSEDPEVRSEESTNCKYFDELSYTNSMFNKTVGELARERGDYFSSDRETAAVVKAFFEMGVKLEVTHKDISENYILEYESENKRVKLFDKNHVYIGSFGSQMNSSGSIYFGFLSKNNNTEPNYIPVEGISNEETDKLFDKAKAIFMENGIDVNNFEQDFIDNMKNIDPDDSYYELFRDNVTGKLISEELNQMGFVKDPDGNYVLDDIKVSLSLVYNNKENPALIISHISDPAVMQTIHLNDSYAKKHSLGMSFKDLLKSGWLKETKNPNLKSFIDGNILERDFIGKYIPDADNNKAVTLLDDITAYEDGFSDVLKSFKDFKDAWDIPVSSEQEVSEFGGKLQKALYNAAEAIKDKKAYADSLLRYAEKYKPGMEDPDNVYGKFKFHEDELKVFLKVNMINASIYNMATDINKNGTQIVFALMSSKDKRHYGYITADFDDPANCKYNFTDLKDHNLDISLTENISKMRDFCEKGKPFYGASENHSVNIELTPDGSKLSLTFNEVPDIDLRSSLNWAGFKYSTIAKAWKADFNQENSDKLLATVKKYWPDDYEHAAKQMESIGTKPAAEHKKESVSVDFSQIENTSEKLAENIKFINEKYPEYKGNLTHILTDIMFNATSKNRNEILDKFRDCNNKDELNSKLKKMVYGSFETEIKKQQNVKSKKDPEEGFSR